MTILSSILMSSVNFAQEIILETTSNISPVSIIKQELKQIGYRPAWVRVPWERLDYQTGNSSVLRRLLDHPIDFYESLLEATKPLSPMTNAKALGKERIKRRARIFEALGLEPISFEKFLLKSRDIQKTLIPVFLKKYSPSEILKLAEGDIPGRPKIEFKGMKNFPLYKKFKEDEEKYYQEREFFRNLGKEKFSQFVSLPLMDSTKSNRAEEMLKIIRKVFPDLKIIFGSTNDDSHRIGPGSIMIFEPGGDDTYRWAGEYLPGTVQIIVDAAGDDFYLRGKTKDKNPEPMDGSSSESGRTGLGFSLGGLTILVDLSGNDTYRTENFSLASAVFGISIFYDASGNDLYESHKYAQAYSYGGLAYFFDEAGDDRYFLRSMGQGASGVGGIAIFHDGGGNDFYYARGGSTDSLRYESKSLSFAQGVSLGHRPFGFGGIGILLDESGSDIYEVDLFGQGSSYWPGFGALIDLGGDDSYRAQQYSQGAGIHLGHGLLYDQGGNDRYESHAASIGYGHDLAIGTLFDTGGNDRTEIYNLGIGAGNANSFGFYIDTTGRDRYYAGVLKDTLGYGNFRRGYSSLGIFYDEGRHEKKETNFVSYFRYEDRINGREKTGSFLKGFLGIGKISSVESGGQEFITNVLSGYSSEKTRILNGKFRIIQLESSNKEALLVAASAGWTQKDKARIKLEQLKKDPVLLLNLFLFFADNHDPGLNHYLTGKLSLFDPEFLLDAVRKWDWNGQRDRPRYFKNLFRIFTEIRSPDAVSPLLSLLEQCPPSARSAGLFAIGRNGGVSLKKFPELIRYIRDQKDSTRKNAVLALKVEKDTRNIFTHLALTDSHFSVRDAALFKLVGVKEKFTPRHSEKKINSVDSIWALLLGPSEERPGSALIPDVRGALISHLRDHYRIYFDP